MFVKEKVYSCYAQMIKGKVDMLQQTLADLKESGTNETKSTAGDKHETALAMLQIEQANTRTQLQEALAQQEVLRNLNPITSVVKVINGSLVKTSKGYFYISVALGKKVVEAVAVFALSPQSPLGAKLLGLVVGDSAEVNGNNYLVETIL